MNNLIDIINQWANRLTIRVLMLSGVPEDQINKVIEGMKDRNRVIDAGEKKLKSRFTWVKWLIIGLITIGIIIITLKIKKLRK